MALTQLTKNMAVIQALDDEPNDVGGLTSAQLKAKFDEGGEAVKTFINGTLLPELETAFGGKVPLERTVNGHPLSGSVTVTKADVGLGSADNTADLDKPLSAPQKAYVDQQVLSTVLGQIPDASLAEGKLAAPLQAKIDAAGPALHSNLSVYVSPTGSDTAGDGSPANPYATPNRALADIPKNLNGYTAYVHLATGTYSGITTIRGFHGGTLWLGDINGNAEITLGKVKIYNSESVGLNIDTISGSGDANTGTLFVSTSGVTLGQETTIDGLGTAFGAWIQDGGAVETGYGVGLTINHCPLAVWCMANGRLDVHGTIAGTGNTTGLQSTGSMITFGSCTMTADTLYAKERGGQILTGAGVSPT